MKKEKGQVSRLLLVLAVVVLVAVIITYLIMRLATKPPSPAPVQNPAEQPPVYVATLGNIKFVFESAINKQNVLRASQMLNPQYSSQSDLHTTEQFIQVVVGAQNVGTQNTELNAWDLGNIVDSEGREFVPEDSFTITPWLPPNNACGALLKPAFNPTPCTQIYEVSKESTGLKIRVESGQGNSASNLASGKKQTALIDLIVK